MLDIPLIGDHDEVRAGSALITLVEAHPGHEIAYNRWYERDHFFSGVVMGPWVLGGRRYIAPAALKALRYSRGGWPVESGTFLAFYLFQDDHKEDFLKWGSAQVAWLRQHPERNFDHRDHLFGSTHDLRWTWCNQDNAFPAHLATVRSFPGLVMIAGDIAEDADPAEVDCWHQENLSRFPFSEGLGVTLAFNPGSGTFVPEYPIEGDVRKFVHLHFLEADPLESGIANFDSYRLALEGTGLATLNYMSPFVATVPGSDLHVETAGAGS